MTGRARGEWNLNDQERSQWIDNDEFLYRWHQSSRKSKRAFIRENREELDDHIRHALGRKPEARGTLWG